MQVPLHVDATDSQGQGEQAGIVPQQRVEHVAGGDFLRSETGRVFRQAPTEGAATRCKQVSCRVHHVAG